MVREYVMGWAPFQPGVREVRFGESLPTRRRDAIAPHVQFCWHAMYTVVEDESPVEVSTYVP
jgi:hypothetical protein